MSAVSARFLLLSLIVAALCALVPSTASAWTRTDVRGMRARAEVMPSGFARIGLEITVEVQGGWVERFEIAGLGQGAQLDPLKPPTWVKTSVALDDTDATPGTKYLPQLKLRDDGTLTLDFGPRMTAPRRGTFISRVVYETRLAQDDRGALVLALPTWPSALENVELWIDAPRGTQLTSAERGEAEITQAFERGALSAFRILKAQLPRTHPLEAHLALPGTLVAEPIAAPQAMTAATQAGAPRPDSWLVAAALLALVALKRRVLAAPPRAEPEAAFTALKAALLALPCAIFPVAHAWSTGAGALVLALAVGLGLALPLQLNEAPAKAGLRYRRAHAIDVQRVRRARLAAWLGPRSWLDATTPSGIVLLALSGALAVLATQRSTDAGDTLWLEAWAIALPLFIAKTRFARSLDASDALLALAEARATLAPIAEAHGARCQLEVAGTTPCGPAERARLRIVTGQRELALVLAEDAHGTATLAWLITEGRRSTLRKAVAVEYELPELLISSNGAAANADELARAA
jgi:hypothetical protein